MLDPHIFLIKGPNRQSEAEQLQALSFSMADKSWCRIGSRSSFTQMIYLWDVATLDLSNLQAVTKWCIHIVLVASCLQNWIQNINHVVSVAVSGGLMLPDACHAGHRGNPPSCSSDPLRSCAWGTQPRRWGEMPGSCQGARQEISYPKSAPNHQHRGLLVPPWCLLSC